MPHTDSCQPAATQLRIRAEALASEKTPRTEEILALSTEEIQKAVHELNVHQIQLEMQNEELLRTQHELDTARKRYFDLYDLAPVGYLTLSTEGLILEANLAAANLLSEIRGKLVRQPFTRFIFKEDQDIFYLGGRQDGCCELHTCDLRLVRSDGTVFWAHLMITAMEQIEGHSVCKIVLNDITTRKQMVDALRSRKQEAEAANKFLELVLDTYVRYYP